MGEDRCVHAVTANAGEVVRYERSGKWYLENSTGRHRLTLAGAAGLATGPRANAHLGLPGGRAFLAAWKKAVDL